jgi:hypothetical protein
MIYFAQAEGGGPIKIGCSELVEYRCRQISIDQQCKMTILAVMDGSFPLEKSLHRRFKHLRVRVGNQREWFSPEPELLEFIAKNGTPWKPGFSPQGEIIADNLIRLGWGYRRVRPSRITKLVTENTGQAMSTQTVCVIFNSIRVSPAKIKRLADGLGVDPSELTRMPKGGIR